MLVLKPKGRGNWASTTVELKGPHVQPMLFRVGSTLLLAGVVFRICEVIP